MSRVDKDAVLAQLTPEAVAQQYQIVGRWFGRWMRAKRCPMATHNTDAFGLSRDGKWHCHACDEGGGDLLSLVAAFEGLDCRADFPAVLEVAAAIAGVDVEEDFGAPAARKPAPPKAPAPPAVPLADRLAIAKKRAAMIWARLDSLPARVDKALSWRHVAATARTREDVRLLGFIGAHTEVSNEIYRVAGEDDRTVRAIRNIYSGAPGWAIAVRHIETGELVDVRARRFEPAADAPKILGMPGGVTSEAGELVACYGWPHELGAATVVVVEGWADYLTAAWRWPRVDVLGAVDAGQYPLVAGFASRYLAERGAGRLVLVAQDDGEGKAADKAVNLASKRSLGLLGPERVTWIEAAQYHVKDLNDIVAAGRASELPEVT